ncbi:zinc ribbon-containing protein [Thalassotalea sp. PLHSN55]|uniref:zinc ribbon-containing protein n=1 Tax=Thalassotalea sp. PLHSN55 TaxID=3435888 RepID=UPI003F87E23E
MVKHNEHHKNAIENIYGKLSEWLSDVQAHELTSVVELVEKTKQYAKAAEALPEEKVKQFIDNFNYDLNQFYQLNQQQAEHSLYLGVLNETFWQLLAKMTDKSQVEWAELSEDFAHKGHYQCGDIIGFGDLKCDQCEQSVAISHLTTVSECIHCGGTAFTRLPYTDS